MHDLTEVMGIGSFVGELRQGPDGGVYQWTEGVDGLGNPVGFWKKIIRGAGKLATKAAGFIPGVGPVLEKVRTGVKKFCGFLPRLEPCVQQFPDAMPIYNTATKVCDILKETGLAGVDGPILAAPDGSHYEMVEGVGELGERRRMLRRVELCIPARLRRRPGGQGGDMRMRSPSQPVRRIVRRR